MPPDAPIDVLLVEDEAGDIELILEAFRQNEIAHTMHVVRDGEEAMRYLRREGEHADARRPDLVVLDLNLPRKSGFEVLADVKADEDLKIIPIIVLSTSEAPIDIQRSYHERASAYLSKPADFDRFVEIVSEIDAFYVETVSLPPRPKPDQPGR